MEKHFKARFNQFLAFFDNSPAAIFLFAELIIGIIFSVTSALLFLKILTEILDKDGQIYDHLISQFVYHLRTPVLTDLMLFFTNLGSVYFISFMLLLIIILLWRHHPREVLIFLGIFLMGVAINLSLKQLIQRPRPDLSPLVVEKDYSFPSGHSMNSFVFYSLIAWYIYHFTHQRRLSLIIGVVCVVLILLIGFSRIYLGVHYPSDVLAGYLVGLWWFVTALSLDKTLTFFKLYRGKLK